MPRFFGSRRILLRPALVFPPTFTSISPTNGDVSVNTPVTITGTNFTGTTSVKVGGVSATSVVVVNSTTITCTFPTTPVIILAPSQAFNVVITTPVGTATGTNAYTYNANIVAGSISPTSGPFTGGTAFTISGGFNLTTVTRVSFNGTDASGFTTASTSITGTTPVYPFAVANQPVFVQNAYCYAYTSNNFTFT